MTLREVQSELARAFHAFEDPQLEARHLLLEALGIDLNQLVLRSEDRVAGADLVKLAEWREARLRGIPLAYLSGKKYFYRHEFIVKAGVLVPRPESELVVETALRRKPDFRNAADFGSGTGCIGLSLLLECPHADLIAIDRSPFANEVTRLNAEKFGIKDRVTIVNQDLAIWRTRKPLDLVVANPPYIDVADPRVQKSVRDFEPHEALFSEDQGLAHVRAWAVTAYATLKPDGVFVTEIGSGQTPAVQEIMARTGFVEIEMGRDLSGHDRVISARKSE